MVTITEEGRKWFDEQIKRLPAEYLFEDLPKGQKWKGKMLNDIWRICSKIEQGETKISDDILGFAIELCRDLIRTYQHADARRFLSCLRCPSKRTQFYKALLSHLERIKTVSEMNTALEHAQEDGYRLLSEQEQHRHYEKWTFENTAFLRLQIWNLQDIGTTPQEIAKEIHPANYLNRLWIPQTLGDQIWLWYEFESREEKDNFLAGLPQKYKDLKGFVAFDFNERDLDHWTGYLSYEGRPFTS